MSAPARIARVKRTTKETTIDLEVDLDGGEISIETGVDFFDHMLHALALHGGMGVKLRARGDGMDNHHLIEDVGIAPRSFRKNSTRKLRYERPEISILAAINASSSGSMIEPNRTMPRFSPSAS